MGGNVKLDTKRSTLHRRGAAEARRAHNPEVIRSKRIAGILQFVRFTEAGRGPSSPSTFTGVAQRQRAGLITPRSYDRNVSPVSFYTPDLKI